MKRSRQPVTAGPTERFAAAETVHNVLCDFDREDRRRVIAAALIMLGDAPSCTALADMADVSENAS